MPQVKFRQKNSMSDMISVKQETTTTQTVFENGKFVTVSRAAWKCAKHTREIGDFVPSGDNTALLRGIKSCVKVVGVESVI